MAISEQELVDVVFCDESAGAVFVVPFNINTRVFLSLPVSIDCVVFLQCVNDMLCVLFADMFDAKIIDGLIGHDRAPFVQPQAWGGGGFILSFFIKALAPP